jgi:hypothetical protein
MASIELLSITMFSDIVLSIGVVGRDLSDLVALSTVVLPK